MTKQSCCVYFRITPLDKKSSNISFSDVYLIDPGRGVLMTSFPIVRYERIVVDTCICPLDDFLLGETVRFEYCIISHLARITLLYMDVLKGGPEVARTCILASCSN